MAIESGRYLGSVRCLETLRERCVMGDGGCWHLRSARGKPMPTGGTVHQVWLHGSGRVSATKVAWELAHETPLGLGLIAYRACDSYDCVNPEHLRSGTRAQWGAHLASTDRLKGGARSIGANRTTMRVTRKLSDEQARMVRNSNESGRSLAARLGVSTSLVNDIRRGLRYRNVVRGSSVFALGGRS